MRLAATSFQNIPNLAHGFFTRNGGASSGIYASLNCGYGSDDAPHIVTENRRRVAAEINVAPDNVLSVHQMHGTNVVTVTEAWTPDSRPHADAMVTNVPGFGLGVLTADCAPVLFVDPTACIIGAAHAGWKGAFAGVLEATVAAMETLGATRENIHVAIGPCIAQASYEVDATFHERFLTVTAGNAKFFKESSRAERAANGQPASEADQGTHFLFDLPAYTKHRLLEYRLKKIEVLGNDTYAEESSFFSFRRATHRAEPNYGRQISVIALT